MPKISQFHFSSLMVVKSQKVLWVKSPLIDGYVSDLDWIESILEEYPISPIIIHKDRPYQNKSTNY